MTANLSRGPVRLAIAIALTCGCRPVCPDTAAARDAGPHAAIMADSVDAMPIQTAHHAAAPCPGTVPDVEDNPQEGAAILKLPYVDYGNTPPPEIGIAPGELPGPLYPAGTVYLARSEGDGAYVSEWDLARRTLRRRVKMDPTIGQWGMKIQRLGDALHVLAWAYNGTVSYVRLTTNLDLIATTPLGEVTPRGPATLAPGDNVTAVLFDGIEVPIDRPNDARAPGRYDKKPTDSDPANRPSGMVAASFDAQGHLIAKRILHLATPAGDFEIAQTDNAIVRGDRIFVALVSPNPHGLQVLRLRPDLSPEEQFAVTLPKGAHGRGTGKFYSWHDRLFITGDTWEKTIELHQWGAKMREVANCVEPYMFSGDFATGRDVWLNDEHVIVHRPDWIEWVSGDKAKIPLGPCPDAP